MKEYFKTLWNNPTAARKAFVALLGVIVQVGVMVFPTAAWVPVAVAVATALGVYHVRNRPVVNRKEVITR